MVYQPDREKYVKILREKGLSQAISDLHHEIWEIEQECFEGSGGYNPEIYEDLKQFHRPRSLQYLVDYGTTPTSLLGWKIVTSEETSRC